MVFIAVVGGTGGVGKTLVDAFNADGKHEVIVLSRKVPEGKNAAPVFAVDYANVSQLTKILDENKVHTVISALTMVYPASAQAELNMIAAAAASIPTKRFIASNWATPSPVVPSLRLPFNVYREQSIAALRKTSLEWTQIYNGFYIDYYGMPHVDTYLSPFVFAIDIPNKMAALPGPTGDEIASFTYTKDLGKFVVKALTLDKWEEALWCFSENASFKDLVKIAEEVTGSKFNVTHDDVAKMKRGEVTELPSHLELYPYIPKPMLQGILAGFGLWSVNGLHYVPREGSLNAKFPDITTTPIKEVLDAWKGKLAVLT
ncbi:NAD(P)-binding protein [Massarina eburnea CBS 473.64]|uniref:NAD(P)-binding protein n=1 Tax=Massarina eburnea CBS 473.64 TaxID=1395130 RepID=A0A6A6RZW6_9PLEO|nr:NAD(P)-binding protein [Massarina eburnea CBS 473.64]